MGRKKKYYVIWRGHKTGIFESWNECKNLIQGFPNASYKSFHDRETAEKAFFGNADDFLGKASPKKALSAAELSRIGTPIQNSLSVDAACSGNPGVMEYQGVMVGNNQAVFHKGPFPQGTVNIGEFLALVHGLAFLKQHNSKIPIYSDSRTAMAWVRDKRANTKLPENQTNKPLFELVRRAENWLQNNSWENKILKWETAAWGEIPADFGRK
jgi:ribonuclease HI